MWTTDRAIPPCARIRSACFTTAAPHGYTTSDVIPLTISGASPTAYNGTFQCTITGASTFTYPLASNPGSETVPGTYTPEDVSELVAMATTFFAQGNATSVYVLELGKGTAAEGVVALEAFIVASPQQIYSYLVPRYWANETSFLAFLAGYEATTSKTYFFVTMTTANYTSFTPLMKCVVGLIEAPGIPITEFTLAGVFFVTLSYAPSGVSQVPPLTYAGIVGVTPYPTVGNAALLQTLKSAFVNIVKTGAEGGLTSTYLFYGTTMDGRKFNYWYAVDWAQINLQLFLANAIINGSNNPLAPLYYNQPGINTLQGVAESTMSSGVSYGLFNGPVVVNAISFAAYLAANPSDYKNGVYNGLSATATPTTGFESITFYLNVSDYPAA